jgi:hypothetical protein
MNNLLERLKIVEKLDSWRMNDEVPLTFRRKPTGNADDELSFNVKKVDISFNIEVSYENNGLSGVDVVLEQIDAFDVEEMGTAFPKTTIDGDEAKMTGEDEKYKVSYTYKPSYMYGVSDIEIDESAHTIVVNCWFLDKNREA